MTPTYAETMEARKKEIAAELTPIQTMLAEVMLECIPMEYAGDDGALLTFGPYMRDLEQHLAKRGYCIAPIPCR